MKAPEAYSTVEPTGTSFETPLSATVLVDISLLTMLVVCAVAMIRMRRLFGVAMLSGIYSLLSALFFVAMDAVDVAFTEAAVGAGVSTVLVLSGMALASRREKPVSKQRVWLPLFVVVIVGAALMYATIDMPHFGDPMSPANSHVGAAYIERTPDDITVPNIVTGVLASYRGYDTMGEVLVVFTAGLACLLLIGTGSMRGGRKIEDPLRLSNSEGEPVRMPEDQLDRKDAVMIATEQDGGEAR